MLAQTFVSKHSVTSTAKTSQSLLENYKFYERAYFLWHFLNAELKNTNCLFHNITRYWFNSLGLVLVSTASLNWKDFLMESVVTSPQKVTRIRAWTSPAALRKTKQPAETTTSSSTLTAGRGTHSPLSACDVHSPGVNKLKITAPGRSAAWRAAKLRQSPLPVGTSPVRTASPRRKLSSREGGQPPTGRELQTANTRVGSGAILWLGKILHINIKYKSCLGVKTIYRIFLLKKIIFSL